VKQPAPCKQQASFRRMALIVCIIAGTIGCSPTPHHVSSPGRSEYRLVEATTHERTTDPSSAQAISRSLPELPLSLQATIETALHNNPGLTGAAWQIEQATALRALAEARFWPHLSVYTEYTQGDAPSAYLFKKIDQRQLPPRPDFNDPGWFENFESGIRARINLYNGGTDLLAHRIAENQVKISQLGRDQLINELVSQVIKSYFAVLAAEDFIKIAEESVATITEQLRIMRIRHQGGAVLKSDVLSMEVRLAQAEEQLVSSRNRLNLARASLATLLGLDPGAFSREKHLLSSSEPDLAGIPEEYENGVMRALNRRPECAQARQKLINARLALDSAKRSYLPRLDLTATYYLDDSGLDYDTERDNWTAALLLNWDLFKGFSRPAEIRRSEAVVEQMLAADKQTVLAVKLDVKRAYFNLEEARSRYQVAQSSVDGAEESFRLVREHYQGGAVTITRYLNAELDRNRARIRATAAHYDTITAHAEVARALGQWAWQIDDGDTRHQGDTVAAGTAQLSGE
jgi:outer membrane protein